MEEATEALKKRIDRVMEVHRIEDEMLNLPLNLKEANNDK